MRLKQFTGLDNQNKPLDVGLGGLVTAKNVDIDRSGRIKTRSGFSLFRADQIAASWNNLVLTNNQDLLRITESGTIETLAQGIPGNQLTGAEVAGKVYFCTDEYSGVIEGSAVRRMGVPLPNSIDVVHGLGNLKAGRYLITATCIAPDGRESGSLPAEVIEVTDNSRIDITVDTPDGCDANIYVSGRDGEELYLLVQSKTATISNLSQTLNSNEPLQREYKATMPQGQLMCEHRGHLVVALSDTLFYSDPIDYETCDYISNVIPMDSEITLLVSVETGLFVSTHTHVWFLGGPSFEEVTMTQAFESPALPGTAQRISLDVLGNGDSSGYAVMFSSKDGDLCAGFPDGSVKNISLKKYRQALPGRLASAIHNSKFIISSS